MADNQVGYYYGVLDIYFALMTKAETVDAKPEYAAPKLMGKTIECEVSPTYKEGKVYASNVATRNEKRIDGYTVKLNLDQIPYAVRREVLGRNQDTKGVQIIKGSQVAPNTAILFAITLDNGAKELWVLYKGKFSELSQTAKTDADNRTYQHPVLEGAFVRRENDDALAAIVETGAEGVDATTVNNWFKGVYETEATGIGP